MNRVKAAPKNDPKGKNTIIIFLKLINLIIKKISPIKLIVGGAEIFATHNINTNKLKDGNITNNPLLR